MLFSKRRRLISKRRTPAKAGPEHRIQAGFFAWLSTCSHPAAKNTFAIPNSAIDSNKKSLLFAREGVRRGVPDVLVAWPSRGWCGLFIEFKTETGEVRPEQLAWHERLTAANYFVVVVRSTREAIRIFTAYLDETAP